MNMTPNDPRTEVSTCKSSGTQLENSEACMARIQALTVKETASKAHMQVHTNKESCMKQPGRKMGPNRPRKGLGRPTCSDRPRGLLAQFDVPFCPRCLSIYCLRRRRPPHRTNHYTDAITRKPPPQDEGESWMSSSRGSTPAERRKQEDSKPLT
jgi:hypothetical protein